MSKNKISVTRYHDFSMGHCVSGHKRIDENGEETEERGGCYNLHGHNYRIFFTIEGTELDSVGRVIDFNAIKAKLCTWLEDNWDHKFLIFKDDERATVVTSVNPEGVVVVDFNPTAENLGQFLINVVAPVQLEGTGTKLTKVIVEETRKCAATVKI